MRAALVNETNLNDAEVRSIVNWVLDQNGLNLPTLGVHLQPTLKAMHTGEFIPDARLHEPPPAEMRALPPAVEHLITGLLPYVPLGVNWQNLADGPLPYSPRTWQECLVCLIAHESQHYEEWISRDDRGDPFLNPPYSEHAAEWREYRMWRLWTERKEIT